MNEQDYVASLLKAGGRRWTKNGADRVYFNDLPDLYGLKVQYYNTGNVSSARLDGEKISNTSAREYLALLGRGKFWYDIDRSEFDSRDLAPHTLQRLIDGVTRRLEAS